MDLSFHDLGEWNDHAGEIDVTRTRVIADKLVGQDETLLFLVALYDSRVAWFLVGVLGELSNPGVQHVKVSFDAVALEFVEVLQLFGGSFDLILAKKRNKLPLHFLLIKSILFVDVGMNSFAVDGMHHVVQFGRYLDDGANDALGLLAVLKRQKKVQSNLVGCLANGCLIIMLRGDVTFELEIL